MQISTPPQSQLAMGFAKSAVDAGYRVSGAALCCWFLLAGPLLAAENGILVVGSGSVLAKPTHLEIVLQTAGQGELTGDAVVKYRGALSRLTEAFAELDVPNLSLQQEALGVASASAGGQAYAIQVGGQPNPPAGKTPVTISRSVRLTVGAIDELDEEQLTETVSLLIDTAKDSGATVGKSTANAMLARMMGQQMSSSIVTFVVDKVEPLRAEAYQIAFAEARQKAERLAELAGARVGPVLSVEETALPSSHENPQVAMMAMMYGLSQQSDKEESRVTSDKLEEIPIRVNLQVRFSLVAD